MPGTIRVARPDGSHLQLEVKTRFPWDGKVEISVVEAVGEWQMALRLPTWARECKLSVDDQPANLPMFSGSYARINPSLRAGQQVTLELSMAPYYVQANPRVDDLRGSLAIRRGPLIYCLEQADQPENVSLLDAAINPYLPLQDAWQAGLLGGVMTVRTQGIMRTPEAWQDNLYLPDGTVQTTQRTVTLTAVPYYAWANRGPGAMRIWIPKI
jgi:DUF1680 family protein